MRYIIKDKSEEMASFRQLYYRDMFYDTLRKESPDFEISKEDVN